MFCPPFTNQFMQAEFDKYEGYINTQNVDAILTYYGEDSILMASDDQAPAQTFSSI